MSRNKFLPYALLVVSPVIFAAQPPSAGKLQQIPQVPSQQQAVPALEAKPVSPAGMAAPDKSGRFRIQAVKYFLAVVPQLSLDNKFVKTIEVIS